MHTDVLREPIKALMDLNSSISNAYNQKKKYEDDKNFLESQIRNYQEQINNLNDLIDKTSYNITYTIEPLFETSYSNYLSYINSIHSYFTIISDFINENRYCKWEKSTNISTNYTNYDFIIFDNPPTIDDNNIKYDDIYNIKYNKITIIDNKKKNEADSIIKTSNTVKLDNLSTLLDPYEKITNTDIILSYINSTLELDDDDDDD